MNGVIITAGTVPAAETTEKGALQAVDVSGMFSSFISYLDNAPSSVATYTRALRPFIRYVKENGITAPAREDVIRYRDALKERYKPATVQIYMTAVRLFFQWAEDNNLYSDVTRRVRVAKVDRQEHAKDYLTPVQVVDVLRTAQQEEGIKGLRDYAMLYLMLAAGLRCIEVSRANVEDLRPRGEHSVIYVQGKGHEDRRDYVRISPEAEKAVRAYLTARGAKSGEPLFAATGNRRSEAGRMSTRAISGTVKSVLKAAGYDSDRLTAHSTRHTAVTLALMNGESLEQVQQFARHKSMNTTLIYAHELERDKNDCSDVITAAIERAMKGRKTPQKRRA